MAVMVSCNMCGRVLPYNKTYFVKFYRRTEPDKGNNDGIGLDICQKCRERLIPVDSVEDYQEDKGTTIDGTQLLTTRKVFIDTELEGEEGKE